MAHHKTPSEITKLASIAYSLVAATENDSDSGASIKRISSSSSSISDDDDDLDIGEWDDNFRQQTLMAVKLKRIKEGKSQQGRSKKKKIRMKGNKSLKDWWKWYWQKPRARFPFLYFLVILLSCIPLSIYWFMDNDSCFILCGIVGLSMFIYAIRKFRLSLSLKMEVDKYRSLNSKFKKENGALRANIKRFQRAHDLLKTTKSRLTKANNKNRRNLNKFEKVQDNMRIIGKKTATELKGVNTRTQQIRQNWRMQMLDSERTMLHAVFRRYETTRGGKQGMKEEDFKAFKLMLPKRYQARFDRMGTFHTFAGDNKMFDGNDFAATLDTFALMETDNEDIEMTVTPVIGDSEMTSFRVTTRDEFGNVFTPDPTIRSSASTSSSAFKGLLSIQE